MMVMSNTDGYGTNDSLTNDILSQLTTSYDGWLRSITHGLIDSQVELANEMDMLAYQLTYLWYNRPPVRQRLVDSTIKATAAGSATTSFSRLPLTISQLIRRLAATLRSEHRCAVIHNIDTNDAHDTFVIPTSHNTILSLWKATI
jgi:hypothetical protein